MAKNLCGKIVTPENAYEVWQTNDGWFTTYVLRKYKNPDQKEKDPFARWYVCTKSPPTSIRGEYADTYAAEVKRTSKKLDYNPLVSYMVDVDGRRDQPYDEFHEKGSTTLYHLAEAEQLFASSTKVYYHVLLLKRTQTPKSILIETLSAQMETPPSEGIAF